MQGYDRYAYVNNDPTNLTDPSGHFGKCREGMSDYLCKVRKNKAHALEQQWAQEAAKKKATLIAQQILQQEQQDSYWDRLLGHTGGGLPVTGAPWLTGSGNPFATPQTSDYQRPQEGGDPMVSIAAGGLLVMLGILDAVLAVGIISIVITPGAQIGLAGELILIPLEATSLDLTIYAYRMATTGSTKHDPLELFHDFAPGVLPYTP